MNLNVKHSELIEFTSQLGGPIDILRDVIILCDSAIPIVFSIKRLTMNSEIAIAEVGPELSTAENSFLRLIHWVDGLQITRKQECRSVLFPFVTWGCLPRL